MGVNNSVAPARPKPYAPSRSSTWVPRQERPIPSSGPSKPASFGQIVKLRRIALVCDAPSITPIRKQQQQFAAALITPRGYDAFSRRPVHYRAFHIQNQTARGTATTPARHRYLVASSAQIGLGTDRAPALQYSARAHRIACPSRPVPGLNGAMLPKS